MKQTVLHRCLFALLLVVVLLVPVALRPITTSSAPTDTRSPAGSAVESLAPLLSSSAWYGWQNLGKTNGYATHDPVIGQNQDGHLEILAWAQYGTGTTDNAVYRRNQTAVNGSSWTAWAPSGDFGGGHF